MLPLLDRMAAWALPVTLMSTAMPPRGNGGDDLLHGGQESLHRFLLGRAFPFPNAEPVFDGGDKALSQLRAQDAPGHAPHDTTGGSAERSEKAPRNAPTLAPAADTRPATGKAAGRVCRGIDLLSHGGIGIKENRRHCRSRSQKSRAPARAFGPVKLRPGDHFALAGLFSAWSPRSCGSARPTGPAWPHG